MERLFIWLDGKVAEGEREGPRVHCPGPRVKGRSHLREMAARSFKARCGVTLALLGLLALARGAPLPPRPNVRCGTRFHRAPPLSRAVFCSRIHATNVCFFLPLIAGRLEDCCAVVKVKEPETTLRRLPPLEAARG